MLARNSRGIVTIRDVTRTAVAMEQLSKHVSAEKNSRNNRRAVFSVRSLPKGYKKDKEYCLSHSDKRHPSSRQRGPPPQSQDRNSETVVNIWS
jgi:hypothetical protein